MDACPNSERRLRYSSPSLRFGPGGKSHQGTLDDRITQSLTEVIIAVKDQPGFQLFWRQRKAIFFPEFQDYIDTTMSSDRQVSEGVYKDFNPE